MRTSSPLRISLSQVTDTRLALPTRGKSTRRPELEEATDWRVFVISLPAVAAVCYMLLFT